MTEEEAGTDGKGENHMGKVEILKLLEDIKRPLTPKEMSVLLNVPYYTTKAWCNKLFSMCMSTEIDRYPIEVKYSKVKTRAFKYFIPNVTIMDIIEEKETTEIDIPQKPGCPHCGSAWNKKLCTKCGQGISSKKLTT